MSEKYIVLFLFILLFHVAKPLNSDKRRSGLIWKVEGQVLGNDGRGTHAVMHIDTYMLECMFQGNEKPCSSQARLFYTPNYTYPYIKGHTTK